MALLNAVTAIVMELTGRVAAALWATQFINALTGNTSEGLSTQSMEQGGVGLLMTVLIISVPPMASMFFQGTLGNFMHFSAFSPGTASSPGPQGQPPGSYGGGGSYAQPQSTTAQNTTRPTDSAASNPARMAGNSGPAVADAVKTRAP